MALPPPIDNHISVRKARVHNLKSIDLDLPYNQLISVCGLSGSGKSSLAIDTLYAEGQRRYIESFSAYTRQFLEKVQRPDVERIDGIPPSIAVTSGNSTRLSRSTIGTATETTDYLRLLFSKIGQVYCQSCGREVHHDTPDRVYDFLSSLPVDTKVIIAFAANYQSLRMKKSDFERQWQEAGFLRGIIMGESFRLDNGGIPLIAYANARLFQLADLPGSELTENREVDSEPDDSDFEDSTFTQAGNESETAGDSESEEIADEQIATTESTDRNGNTFATSRLLTIDPDIDRRWETMKRRHSETLKPGTLPTIFFTVDRLTIGKSTGERIRDSLESAFGWGEGQLWVIYDRNESAAQSPANQEDETKEETESKRLGKPFEWDGASWTIAGFSRRLRCEDCGIEYPSLEPKLFSFNSPLGACPLCEGFGNLMILDLDLIVPNKNRSLTDGAIAPWNGSSYKHKLEELLEKAKVASVRTNIPFGELNERERDFVLNGNKETHYDGLNGFFIRLQKQKYKMHIRVFLSRWRSYRVCPLCDGSRLRPESLAVRIGGHHIQHLSSLQVSELLATMNRWNLAPWQQEIGQTPLAQLENRLRYLEQVGLGYLTLDRQIRTLSEGEHRRVNLTTVLGSGLVNVLYVLDEPSVGLHPFDTEKLLQSICELRDRGNSVLIVEHEEAILRASDQIVEVGPGAGLAGGEIVFQGTYDELVKSKNSLTGIHLSGRRRLGNDHKRRILDNGFLELSGARGNNLKDINVVFPLGVLCVVTGVSGAGKSSLVQETLYPAICKKLRKGNGNETSLPFDQILGTDQVDDIVLVDQSPIGRSPRSNPVTYLKIFDDIRALFAETPEAKAKGYGAGYFSFNVDGGRCNTCKGEGFIVIDMQFMADMFIRCPQCNGHRYQREILDILCRGKNISEILDLTVREAFVFFRGQPKIQQKLKRLIDVGLDYIRLGQPANTLSGGESQRLKLAAYLSTARKGRCLFILDEPTTGLHFADIVQLLDGFDALIETGHSLIVVEHNLQLIAAADYIIDLGPGPADKGGEIVAEGTPEQIAKDSNTLTGKFLAKSHFLESHD